MTIDPPPLPEDPPHSAGERQLLTWFLQFYRVVMVRKVAGLSPEDASRSTVPSGTNLLSMLKHLAYVERWWFRAVFAGEPLDFPWTDDDPDADFRLGAEDTVERVVALYREETEQASRVIEAAESLDALSAGPRKGFSLRWILIHMIEETSRHAGHADIIREQIDGATGD